MKKISYSLVVLLLMASCITEKYYPVEEYYDTVEPYTFTGEYTVRSTHWQKMDTPPTPQDPAESSIYTFFYYDFEVPELTSVVLDRGVTAAYLVYWDNNNQILTPLPLDDFYLDNYSWIEQATCEFSVGWVRFIIKYSDFDMSIRPGDYTFKIKLMW